MKMASIFICALAGIAGAIAPLISFLGGRRGMPLSIWDLPAQVMPFVIQLLCLLAFIVLLVLARKRHQGAFVTAVCLLISGFLLLGGCLVSQEQMFREGFRHRIQSRISPEELRVVAAAARAQIPVGESLSSTVDGAVRAQTEDDRWANLMGRTSLGKLDSGVVVTVRYDSVELWWGGAMMGNWGLVIYDLSRAEGEQSQRPQEKRSGDIDPSISTFFR
jgi:hypothetical protein